MGIHVWLTGSARPIRMLLIILGAVITWGVPANPADESARDHALRLVVQGAINPAAADYLAQGLQAAVDQDAALVIIEMDTPGGLDRSMRDIIQGILAAPIPVTSYVAPAGARAASAGTYILYASHIAAMAPGTNLGAATPVHIGGAPTGPERKPPPSGEDNKEPNDSRSTMEQKVTNDASAYIKSLAELNGRNAEWAVKAVEEAASLSASEALEKRVIDIIARDIDDLLQQMDGRQVRVNDVPVTLHTAHLEVTTVEPSWRYKVLGIVSDPTVAYLLLLLGFYGLIYELANPGFLLPGVAGAISLLLALYAFQILPINYSGLALLLLGISFLVAEAFLPSFGVLGVGGIIAFTVGSLILLDDEAMRIPLPLIAGTALVSAAFILLLAGRMAVMRRKQVHTGTEAMIGMVGRAREDFAGTGRIWLCGESWPVTCSQAVKKGQHVTVTAVTGLHLTVAPLDEEV